ncbi:MAG: acetylornithine/succinylornithine family transaminase [Chloroflexi bacterium]|nr:acetylornithine/succinylornithine family transaminase [Chloroflexota bacterium]
MQLPWPPETLREWMQAEARHDSGVYAKRDLMLVRGQGTRVWDAQGREYLDCVGGHGVAVVGHSHPAVVAALEAQARRLMICPGSFYNDTRARLLQRLGTLVPGLERVFLANSGTEAVEAALKFARYSTGRPKIVAAKRGFHGRTLGALSATWKRAYRQPFEPLVPEFEHATFNKLDAWEQAVDDRTAALLVEVVQGEGGVHPASAEFLTGLQRLARERGALLIVDEIQTGMGRTGKMFAFQHYGLEPDLVTLAKGLGGGVPIGAVLIGPRVRALKPGLHGSTFGGNPLAAAAALAVLDILEREDLPARAAEVGAYLRQGLARVSGPVVRAVRGLGLMIGVEVRQKAAPYLRALAERGILALPAGMNVVRFLPPLTLTRAEADRILEAWAEVSQAPPAAPSETG